MKKFYIILLAFVMLTTVVYAGPFKADAKTNFFVKASYDHVGTSDFNYNKRNHFTISMGCHF